MTLIGDSYRWLYSKLSSSPTNFSWVINDELAGSGLPLSWNQFKWLLNQGIDTIVTVREIPLPLQWLSDKSTEIYSVAGKNFKKVKYLHLRVDDYKSPTVEEIDATISFIENELGAKRHVLVHCAAGKGRTGTILGAYLLKKENLKAKDAITMIRRIRPGSIQTNSQEKSLYDYEKYLQDKSLN